jgi:SAM-dependent methyltransferase
MTVRTPLVTSLIMTPSPRAFDPLRNTDQMVGLISEVTGTPPEVVLSKLKREFERPGVIVNDDFSAAGLVRYEWSQGMADFYSKSDAFVYELAVWNRNRMKSQMRRWVVERLSQNSQTLNVLCLGDGLGFDCLAFAKAGHRVTYCELPGYSPAFATRLFARTNTQVTVLDDFSAIPESAFDAVVCLDVLEHVSNVDSVVGLIVRYLQPGGQALISAPFFLIHPAYPTHLRANRKHSGSLSLYRQHGLELIGGRPGWNPVIFQQSGPKSSDGNKLEKFKVRLSRLLMLFGRFTVLPFTPFVLLRRYNNRWFG